MERKNIMETSIEKEMDQGNRAFGEMLKAAKGWLKDLPPEKIAKRSGAFFHRENSILELQSLNQTVRIAIPEYKFCSQLGAWHQLVLLHYLYLADGTAVSDSFITFGELKDGLIRGTKFDRTIERELQMFLKGKTWNVSGRSAARWERNSQTVMRICVRFFLFCRTIRSG